MLSFSFYFCVCVSAGLAYCKIELISMKLDVMIGLNNGKNCLTFGVQGRP